MFTQAKRIDTAFRHVRAFTMLVVVGSVTVASLAVYQSYQLARQHQQTVYILAGGKVLEAYASERGENIPVEARDHVATFHRLFFTLSPDDKAIQANLSRALYLADGSAKSQYDALKESGFYTGIIAGNISQEIVLDSVVVDLNRSPYYFRCNALQRIIRPTSLVSRKLVTEGYLRPLARSDRNPHGFLIEKWKILENQDLHIQTR
ncbi:conjugative transposon protein TraK [Rhabdobacter roseus]|uniref:Conjugative transposon TraK protein n=1 Tax=Rhabdobacter roseus TaxID=1655419 RepID=A0A840TZD0_9BACT|nr:conjugative transposon protein TraK [Rhabdobacter roseus]MBB5286653.1 conjugative transposon TraK protein [Rhabdobacter roseus]